MKLTHLFAGTFASVLALGTVAQAETTITYNNFTPSTHFSWAVLADWAGQVEDATEGRVTIQFLSKSVAPPPGVFDAVRRGGADAGYIANVFAQNFAPGTGISMTPWIHRGDAEAAGVAAWRVYSENFADKDNWNGVELLGVFQFAAATLCSVDGAPLDTVDDLRDRKLWALPGTMAAMLGQLDISVTSGPAVQIQEMVSRNVVDAYGGITYDAIDKFGAGPYTEYCFDFEAAPTSTSFSHFISSRVWDGISPEDQQILRDLSGENLAAMMGRANNAAQAASLDALIADGLEVVEPSADLLAGLEAAAAPLTQAWVDSIADYDVDAMAALDQLRALTLELTEANAQTN